MLAATAPALDARGALPRTYHVRTLGCQMNVHDSEHMAGLLEGAGYLRVEDVPEAAARATDAGDGGADVVIINTCSVRENAATRLFGNLGQLAAVSPRYPPSRWRATARRSREPGPPATAPPSRI